MFRTVALFLLVLTACADATEPVAPSTSAAEPGVRADRVVFSADLIGGCAMMGPNCSRYVVYGDGRIEGYRLDPAGPELLATVSVDRDAVARLADLVATTDLEMLRSRLPEGRCQACVDGIDTVITLYPAEGEVLFVSAETELDATEPLFATLLPILDAGVAGIEVPIQTR